MTIYLKSNSIGLDESINEVIETLDYELNTKRSWNIDIYGKLYKKEIKKSKLPIAVSFKSNIDYEPVFVNDKVNGEIGFIVEDKREILDGLVKTNCNVTFSLNIEKIFGISTQREDESIMLIAKMALSDYSPDILITGIKNVYNGFDTEKIIYSDMQPYLNFSYRIKLNYTDKC